MIDILWSWPLVTNLFNFLSFQPTQLIFSDSENMRQQQPLRVSQSFRHRPKPQIDLRRCALEEEGGFCAERRRSTPTVSRRGSLQRYFNIYLNPNFPRSTTSCLLNS